MTTRKKKWLLGSGLAAFSALVALTVAGFVLAGRIEPYAHEQAVRYLSQHFDSDVQLQALHLRVPEISPLRLLLTRRWGATARIEGKGLWLRKHGGAGAGPLLSISKFSGDVNMDSLFNPPIVVSHVMVDGMDLQIPPRNTPPGAASTVNVAPPSPPPGEPKKPSVVFERVDIRDVRLVLLPRDPQKLPLQFPIESLRLESVGSAAGMSYDASLTNPKPPGKIHAVGTFGPWQAAEPGDTPITGNYLFENADLGVFHGIAGTLHSRGHFDGQLSALTVRGEASVPDFRLKRAENPVPLTTRFEVLVDGTNGDTTLQPVKATLGSTNFTTTGGIIKHEANQRRAISLDVNMPDGDLRDVLKLAMKGAPFMEGRLALQTRLDIPPLAAKVREKLILDGRFQVRNGIFHHSTMQSQLNRMSQRATGHAGDQETEQAIAMMGGAFHLENALMHFSRLSFAIPGATLDMVGDYNMDTDALDFNGAVKLEATVSQMVTGWKRVVLKPVDKFFEKEGAGTFLRIRVNGTSKSPQFGLNLFHR